MTERYALNNFRATLRTSGGFWMVSGDLWTASREFKIAFRELRTAAREFLMTS